jgi:signal transduction histidine kinase
LNSIIGFTELMIEDRQDPPPPPRARRLEKVHRNGRNLLALINEILDLARIEAGKFTLACDDVDVPALLADCLESAQPLFAPGVETALHVEPALREAPRWPGDSGRLQQIVYNLLSNAAKFTPRGRIELSAGRGPAGLRVGVADTGIGVPAGDVTRIFEDFEQVDRSSTRRTAGTGLGLAICRRLARLMGGDITVASAPGAGSCFTLRLPFAPPAGAGTPEAPDGHLTGR